MNTSTYSTILIIALFVLAAIFSSCDSNVADSSNILSENIGYANAEAAADTFEVLDDLYSASSGTITVTYLGEQVVTNYPSILDAFAVAATVASDINNDDDIQLNATIPDYSEPKIRIRERRTGAQYNGNPVYLSDSNSTNHIKLSDSVIYLTDGED